MTEVTTARPPKRAEAALEQLQLIETGCGPEVESEALRDLLTRSAGLADSLTDPIEVPNYHNPLASANAYKHRLNALRCEYAQARLRALDLEEQCVRARSLIERLESRVKLLEAPLEQMKSSLAWKVAVKGFRCWWTISQWFRRLRGSVKPKS
jgi:hypothetical protein